MLCGVKLLLSSFFIIVYHFFQLSSSPLSLLLLLTAQLIGGKASLRITHQTVPNLVTDSINSFEISISVIMRTCSCT